MVWDNTTNIISSSSATVLEQDLTSPCSGAKGVAGNKVMSKATQLIIQSSLDWSRLWLTNIACFIQSISNSGLTATINGLLTQAFMH
jgi:hypothetical protein